MYSKNFLKMQILEETIYFYNKNQGFEAVLKTKKNQIIRKKKRKPL